MSNVLYREWNSILCVVRELTDDSRRGTDRTTHKMNWTKCWAEEVPGPLRIEKCSGRFRPVRWAYGHRQRAPSPGGNDHVIPLFLRPRPAPRHPAAGPAGVETHEEGADVGHLGAHGSQTTCPPSPPLWRAGRLRRPLRESKGIQRGHHHQTALVALGATLDVDAREPTHHRRGGFRGQRRRHAAAPTAGGRRAAWVSDSDCPGPHSGECA